MPKAIPGLNPDLFICLNLDFTLIQVWASQGCHPSPFRVFWASASSEAIPEFAPGALHTWHRFRMGGS